MISRAARLVVTSLALLAPTTAGCGGARTEVPAAAPAAVGGAADAAGAGAGDAVTLSQRENADAAFGRVAAAFLARYVEIEPVLATIAGDHRYDGRWPDWSKEGDSAARTFYEATRGELAPIAKDALSEQNRIDAAILETQIAFALFTMDELRPAEVNPVAWTGMVGDGLDALLTRNFAPASERMRTLATRLRALPAVVTAAKARLAAPARVNTETAIAQNKGLVALTSVAGMTESLGRLQGVSPTARAEVLVAARAANAALTDFQAFLEKDLLARSTGDFRLGRDRFAKKLAFLLEDDVDPDALVAAARALMVETLDDMAATAVGLWPTLMQGAPPRATTPAEKRALVAKVLAKLGDDHSSNATIVQDATRSLAEVTKHVRDKDLVRVPEEPVRIIEMPDYKRGVAIAYCDPSGPLEKKQETFYAIAPTPRDWPAKRAESFYREYNHSMLVDLTVHEAMPGHYLQGMHQNRFRSDVRALFSNGAFVEGWAVYAEWLLAKSGFGGPRVRIQRQKMVLRMAANTILDHEVHAGHMEEKEALALMMNDAFQEEGEAVGKWKRARLTSAQLTTYFHGFREMMKLRAAAEKEPGFRDRTWHDRVLSYGAPSFRYLRPLMAASRG